MGFLDKLIGGPEQTMADLERAIDAGAADKAEKLLVQMRELFKKGKTKSPFALRADILEARLRWLQGKLELGTNAWRRVYAAAEASGDLKNLREAGFRLFQCLSYLDRHAEIIALAPAIREHFASAADESDRQNAAELEFLLGASFLERGNMTEAARVLQQAIQLFETLPASKERAGRLLQAYSGLGDAYLALTNRPQAVEAWNQALSLTREHLGKTDPQVGTILGSIGGVLLEADDLPGARRCFEEALEVFLVNNQQDTVLAGVALNNLAYTLLVEGDYPAALLRAQEAVGIGQSRDPRLRLEAMDTLQRIKAISAWE